MILTPVEYLLFALLAALVAFTALLLVEAALLRSANSLYNRIRVIERKLPQYRNYGSYLRRKDREAYKTRLGSFSQQFGFLRSYSPLLSSAAKSRLRSSQTKADELARFLDSFVSEYTNAELKRRSGFFAGKSLDPSQIEAIVKTDAYNLVNAPAGSGKTRTLTARLAYLVECGVSPGKILALAYTEAASEEMQDWLRVLYGTPNAEVKTFHSFGRKIAKESPRFRDSIATAEEQRKFIDASIERLWSDRTFAASLLEFVADSRENSLHKEVAQPSESLKECMLAFINRAKTNGISTDEIASRLAHGAWTQDQQTFAKLTTRIWQEYESLLKQNEMIDFADMISCALEVSAKDQARVEGLYSHVLIDEFQDITDPQLELVKRVIGNHNGHEPTSLFCVGDDWQSIFSLAGSDVRNIIDFEKQFPFAEKTVLSANYRCPANVVAASNSVVELNAVRVDKKVTAASREQRPIRLLEKAEYDSGTSYEEWEFQQARALVEELLATKKTSETIMVLARYDRPLGKLELEFPKRKEQHIEFCSVHKAKGREADYVLLLGCVSGRNGFPSEIIDQKLLEIAEKSSERPIDALEEERRLFYVALTRCRKQVFLFTSRDKRSRFVSEIERYLTFDQQSHNSVSTRSQLAVEPRDSSTKRTG